MCERETTKPKVARKCSEPHTEEEEGGGKKKHKHVACPAVTRSKLLFCRRSCERKSLQTRFLHAHTIVLRHCDFNVPIGIFYDSSTLGLEETPLPEYTKRFWVQNSNVCHRWPIDIEKFICIANIIFLLRRASGDLVGGQRLVMVRAAGLVHVHLHGDMYLSESVLWMGQI